MAEETRTLIDAAVEHLPEATIGKLDDYEHVAVISDPQNVKTRLEDLERFAGRPRRLNQKATFETPMAFASYVRDFTQQAQTRVFASLKARQVVAEMDYHEGRSGPDTFVIPAWRGHVAIYPAVFDESFAAWHALHGKPISQRHFAEFLQDRAEDAVTPAPADLMEVAQRFEVLRGVEFKSAVNLSTGEREFKFDEKDKAAGSVAAPKLIKLRTPVFYGCDPVEWVARFAYAIDDGKLGFTITIHRLAELLDSQFERLVDSIAVALPGIPVHRGTVA